MSGARVWALAVAALAAGLFGLGCTAECTVREDDGALPAPAFECPAGQLCYRGRCHPSCNAGREGVQRCDRDDDCAAPRPFCNLDTGFCSGCSDGESCVPTLNICRPVSAPPRVPTPERPEDNDFVPDGPLDASLPDGSGLVRFPDVGAPVALEAATIAVHFEFARESSIPDELACAAPPPPAEIARAQVSVRAWDVADVDRPPDASWRADLAPVATEALAAPDLRDGQCEVRRIDTATTASPTDLGEIAFENTGDELRVLDDWTARFIEGAYALRVDDEPADPLAFVANPRFAEEVGQLQIFGFGRSGVTNGSFGAQLDLPFEFEPNCATLEALRDGLVVPPAPRADLVFGWRDPLNGTTGQVVYVRIDGSAFGHELVCEDSEASGASAIVVSAALLSRFRQLLDAAGAFSGGDRELRVELGRRNLRRLQIDPAPSQLIFATADVGLRFVDTVRFAR